MKNLMEVIDYKLQTSSLTDIINELKLNDDLAFELYGEKYEMVKNKIYTIDNVDYIAEEVNKHGYVVMSRVVYKLVDHIICAGIGRCVHINELLGMESEVLN